MFGSYIANAFLTVSLVRSPIGSLMIHPYRHRQPTHAAFTLAELAIVLVIIGLLVGTVIGSTQLIKQSQMQTVISDYTKYTAAAAQFQQQYGGPPGDIIDASNYWGTDSTYCTVAATDITGGTCNGDGDGKIYTAQIITTIPNTSEPYRAWQQLVLAKLIDGNFSGVTVTGGATNSVPGTNVPASRITGAGWSFYNNTALVGNTDWYAQDLGNILIFGGVISNSLNQGAVLTTNEAWQIDRKIDDGLPAFGRIVALKPSPSTITPYCTTDVVDANAVYDQGSRGVYCSLAMSLTTK